MLEINTWSRLRKRQGGKWYRKLQATIQHTFYVNHQIWHWIKSLGNLVHHYSTITCAQFTYAQILRQNDLLHQFCPHTIWLPINTWAKSHNQAQRMTNHKHNNSRVVAGVLPQTLLGWLLCWFASYLPHMVVAAATAVSAAAAAAVAAVTTGQCWTWEDPNRFGLQ